jgi:hypothetical protein
VEVGQAPCDRPGPALFDRLSRLILEGFCLKWARTPQTLPSILSPDFVPVDFVPSTLSLSTLSPRLCPLDFVPSTLSSLAMRGQREEDKVCLDSVPIDFVLDSLRKEI